MKKCYGEQLLAVGTSIAFKLSQDLSPDDISLLGAFLTTVGDQLSLLSITKSANFNSNQC